jgi:hypothetical protein
MKWLELIATLLLARVKLKGLEFYPPDVFCTYSELHMMSGFINELCALFT